MMINIGVTGIWNYRGRKARGINEQRLVKNAKDSKNDIFRNVQNKKNEARIGPLLGGNMTYIILEGTAKAWDDKKKIQKDLYRKA